LGDNGFSNEIYIHSMIEEELIRKFILNKSNDEERNKVRAYFRENPEILRKYMREEDWNVFT
jgi:hypothetical protein